MRYRDWTLVMAAAAVFTAGAVPVLLHWMHIPWTYRERGWHMDMLRSQEIAWAIMLPFMWVLGLAGIWVSKGAKVGPRVRRVWAACRAQPQVPFWLALALVVVGLVLVGVQFS